MNDAVNSQACGKRIELLQIKRPPTCTGVTRDGWVLYRPGDIIIFLYLDDNQERYAIAHPYNSDEARERMAEAREQWPHRLAEVDHRTNRDETVSDRPIMAADTERQAQELMPR